MALAVLDHQLASIRGSGGQVPHLFVRKLHLKSRAKVNATDLCRLQGPSERDQHQFLNSTPTDFES